MRLRRILWKPHATAEDRQACAAWLRGCGLLPIPMLVKTGGYVLGVWAIKRSNG